MDTCLPLFGYEKSKVQYSEYVKNFAAESVAFLLRKLKTEKLNSVVASLFDRANENPSDEFSDGLALLFYYYMKVCISKI